MKKTNTAQASRLDSHLGFWLRFVSNQVSGRFENLLAEHGLSLAEWVAMRSLYDSEDTTHADLISALGMTKGAASKIISKLEAKKLATRQRAKDSLRGQILALTEAGNNLVPKLAALADANESHYFGHLTDRQRQDLLASMQELVRHHALTQTPTR